MKKILLGTTGLVGAALLATAANAETPKVTLGGFSDFQAGYTSDDFDSVAGGGTEKRAVGFRNDNEVTVKVDGKTNSGLGYGAEIDLEADVTNDADNQGVNASRTFTYLEGSFGRFEMGSNKSVAATQRIDASTIAVATGGINGAWTYFVNPDAAPAAAVPGGVTPVLAAAAPQITTSKLIGEHGNLTALGDETTYNATKVSYYTPKFSGFQAGVSYTPQLDDRGQVMTRSDTASVSDLWDFALGYNNTFNGGWKLGVAGTYEMGNGGGLAGPSGFGTDDVKGWNLGASLGWQGWAVAGSYGDISDSGILGTDANYWTAGLAYATGPIGLSATYIDSTTEVGGVDNDFNNLVIGADYKLAPGFTPYAEVSFYDFDPTGAANDNQGTAVILGTQVAF